MFWTIKSLASERLREKLRLLGASQRIEHWIYRILGDLSNTVKPRDQ